MNQVQNQLINVHSISLEPEETIVYVFECDFCGGGGPEIATYVWRDGDVWGAADQSGLYWQLHAWRLSHPEVEPDLDEHGLWENPEHQAA